ncbi:hypothetical protein DVV94_14695 [Enterococcus faecium]|nr:hypothetical protein DVV94_14695 [Enterococcus faecium]
MVHSDSDLILHNSSVLIDKEPKDQEELIHLISNYSKISLYQHHLTKSQNITLDTVHKNDSDPKVID